ncbi:putative reverse transcriptase domain-containing protein, partial [Tanacetum coccineum]
MKTMTQKKKNLRKRKNLKKKKIWKLTFPYEETDSLNPPPLASDSESEDVIEVKDTVEPEDETVPFSVYETVHALVEKKGKAKDKFYGKLILDLGNEVHSSVEEGADAMKNLVRKLGNAKEKAEERTGRSKVKQHTSSIMPPKSAPLTHAIVQRMIKESVNAAIAAERARHANTGNDARGSRPVRRQDTAPVVRECTFAGYMKCNPTVFHEGKKVKFAAATLEGPALTWWKSKIVTMGLETMNQMPRIEMKQLMTIEFCPVEEIQRMEHELWNVRVKEYNVVAYTQRFNELALMCPRMVEPESAKIDAY